MTHNLSTRSQDERDNLDIDLHASGIVYRERYGMPFSQTEVESKLPPAKRDLFRERLAYFRSQSHRFEKLPYEPKERK